MSNVLEELHAECAPLMRELGEKNHVRVFVHRFQPVGRKWNWSPAELIHDSKLDGEAYALLPEILRMDGIRALVGKSPIYWDEAVRLSGGELRGITVNLRPNIGIDYCAAQLGGTSSATPAKYMALSNNTDSPNATDTSSNTTAGTGINWGTNSTSDGAASNARGELNYSGMARAAATYAHTTAVTSFSQTHTYTASGAVTAVQACGLFDNATNQAGNLFVENTFTATTLANGDQLTIAWTINI